MQTRAVRIIALASALMLIATAGQAQRAWEFGILGGANSSTFSGDTNVSIDDEGFVGSADVTDRRTGFVGGFYARTQMNDWFGLHVGGLWSRQGAQGKINGTFEGTPFTGDLTYTFDYFQFPVLAVFSHPLGGVRLNAHAGPSFALNTTARWKIEGTISGDSFNKGSDIDNFIKATDIGALFGASVEIPMGAVNLVVDGRWTTGITSVDDTGGSIDLKNDNFALLTGITMPLGKVAQPLGKVKGADWVADVVTKDLDLVEQDALLEKYKGSIAWTRAALEDLTERETPGEPKKRIVPRDTKVEIMDLNFAYEGAVMVRDPKRRMIIHGLEVERPLTVEKFEQRLNETFWFKSPMLRHVDYIRQWGKRTARAVRNHEVFIGMPSEAALESWGPPTEKRTNEIGGKTEEQWAYKQAKRTKYIYIIDGKVSKWEE